MIVVIVVMGVVNVVAFLAIQGAGNRLHNDETRTLFAAQQLQFDAADMNGAQILYVLDNGSSRQVFLASEHRLAQSMTTASRVDTSSADRALLGRIAADFESFRALDERVWAALQRGNHATAARLTISPETVLYDRMARSASTLVSLSAAEQVAALDSLNRVERVAILVMLVLDVIALGFVLGLLVDRRRTGRRLDTRTAEYQTLVEQMPLIVYRDEAHTGEPLFVSPQIQAILGYSVDEWLSSTNTTDWWHDRIHPDDVAERLRAAQVIDGRVTAPSFSTTYRVLTKDGKYRWMQEDVTTVDDEHGVPRWRQGIILDVHERLVARRRYEDLINRMPATTTVWDRDTHRVSFVSPQDAELTGEPPAAWTGTMDRFMSRVHPDDLADPTRWPPVDDPLRGGVYRWRRSDGRMIWIREITSPRPGSESDYISLLFDVTPEGEAALELAEQRQRYQTLVEQLPVATYIFDGDGDVTYVSPQVELILGRTAEGFSAGGRTREDRAPWFHPDDLDRTNIASLAVYEGRADGYDFEARMFHADGSIRHVRAIARALKDDRGVRTGVQGVLIDITEEVTARAELEASERRYQALVEQTPVTTYLTTADGQMVYVSPQIERLLGISSEEYLQLNEPGQRLSKLYHPDEVDGVAHMLGALYAGEVDAVDLPTRLITAEGGTREVQMIARALRDQAGVVTHTQGVIVDLTDLRRAERRNREVMSALVNAAEAEQARISVELHDDTVQVMAALLMQVRLLMRTNPSLGKAEAMIAGALERTRQLMFELRPQVLEREGLGAALRAIAHEGPWRLAVVDVEVPRQSVTVEAIVYRAIRELIINARKHSQASRLDIAGRQEHDRLVFKVADDGVGFDPAIALDRTRMAKHIGLDATAERIRLANGELVVDSAPGEGARFRLVVPAEPLADDPVSGRPIARLDA